MITKEGSDTDGPNVAEDGLSNDGTCEVGHTSKHTHTLVMLAGAVTRPHPNSFSTLALDTLRKVSPAACHSAQHGAIGADSESIPSMPEGSQRALHLDKTIEQCPRLKSYQVLPL